MPKRIYWKKGMRLTDDILALSDKCTSAFISRSLALGAAGRMGLFPALRPFSLSVDINKDVIDVVAIDCLGLTRNGSIIDVEYDTNYTNSFDARVSIPNTADDARFLLCVRASDEWRDTNDGMCQPIYSFIVIEENSIVPDDALPVARIVHDAYSWRTDDANFVPPCLYVSSHERYISLAKEFSRLLAHMYEILPQCLNTEGKDALRVFWPSVMQLMISADKNRDTMTPMELLSHVQQFIGAFVCACELDDYINIGEPQQYHDYIGRCANYKDAYQVIREGLDLSLSIQQKVESFESAPVEPKQQPVLLAPTIDKKQLKQLVKSGVVRIEISCNTPGAEIYYTTDGSIPTTRSNSGNTIVIDSGFEDNWHKEPTKKVTIKTIAYKQGETSEVATYEAVIRKGNSFAGLQI